LVIVKRRSMYVNEYSKGQVLFRMPARGGRFPIGDRFGQYVSTRNLRHERAAFHPKSDQLPDVGNGQIASDAQ
jgi:hypothetical protein